MSKLAAAIHRDYPETRPLPPRRIEWRKAHRLAQEVKANPYTPAISYELILALDGGDAERTFQEFLTEPGARRLIEERSDLVAALADRDTLRAMAPDSLGRAYLALMEEDGYTADGLTLIQDQVPSFKLIAPDPIRHWFHIRSGALHDVCHALTGYGRDRAGEAAVNIYTAATCKVRVVLLYSFIGALAAPRKNYLANLAYMHQAWRRGLLSRIPLSTRWEDLLPLPMAEVYRRLQIPSVEESHPRGLMIEEHKGGPWIPASSRANPVPGANPGANPVPG
ncbi:MAG TPA: Coq4 family protein [Kofleriaceae bacterium]|nr:Coq4 family protein [Kofleriaceae bacterium]